jgi:hypothetical protein
VRPNRFALPGRVPDVYGVSARFEIPKFAAIRTHHVSTALSQGSPFCSLIFKCPAWEARSLPELQRRHGQICE